MEENKFNFSEEELEKDKSVAENKEAIKQEARGLFKSINHFLRQLLDFRDDTDRDATISAIKTDVAFRGATAWILVCSIMVASVGLNADSTAVVIGAMLISPLMGPILGVGMGIAINDIDTLRKSLINLAVMIVLSLLTAFLFFFLFPLREETSELFGRKSPDIRDVLIAFFGGLALIIARTKKGTIASVIFGVAIATALMPPLCTAGYGLAIWLRGDGGGFEYFAGAMNLFTINTIFIALATFIVLKVLRFPMLKYANSKKRRRISRIAAFIAVLVMIWPTFTFIRVLNETRLETDYKKFIKNEVESNPKLWLQRAIPKYTEKSITLYFNGEISDATISDLNNELNNYENIKDFKLIFEGNKSRSFDKISDALDRAIEDLEEKEALVVGLQQKIDELEEQLRIVNDKQKSFSFSTLSKDAKIRFADLESFGYANMLQSKDFLSTDTVTLAVVKWKENIPDSILAIKETELLNWLQKQVKTENIILKRE